jgi:hypothetical protein
MRGIFLGESVLQGERVRFEMVRGRNSHIVGDRHSQGRRGREVGSAVAEPQDVPIVSVGRETGASSRRQLCDWELWVGVSAELLCEELPI